MKHYITTILRKNQTPSEAKLRYVLRNRGIGNLKFRRQHRIGNYIVDFCCREKKLVIELDGGHHNDPRIQERDEQRQKFIERQGFKVLRFWNDDIDGNLEGVVLVILQRAGASPRSSVSNQPSPSGERENEAQLSRQRRT